MALDQHEIKALAAFFARRLSTDLRRTDPLDAPVPGDGPWDQWERKLRRADENGTLARVVQTAAWALPGDPALAEAAALVSAIPEPRPRGSSVALGAMIALLLTTFGGLVTALILAGPLVVAPATERSVPGPRADGMPGDLSFSWPKVRSSAG